MNDTAIETPVSSGATDVPNVPQSGSPAITAATPAAALAPLENIMANQAGQKIGYDTTQNAWVDAETRKPYATGTATAPAPSVTLPAQPAKAALPAQPVGKEDMVRNPQTGQTLVFDKSQNAYVDLVTRKPYAAPQAQSNQDQPKAGFLSTVGSDIGNAVTSLAKLPLSVASYATLDRPSAEAAQTVADANEAHKMDVYHRFAQDFHAGNYGKAIYGLTELFNPETEDPNDPLQQVMKAQWDSSKQAKDLAVEAVKSKNYAAAVQHAAGVLPVASKVDSAMENYRTDPSRENLAHIVTSAIPAFIPAIAKGAGAGIEAMRVTNPLAPETIDIAGQPVPVRAAVANPTLGARIAESLATKTPLQEFDVTQTQPAARAVIARVAEEGVTKPTFESLKQAETAGAKTITVTPADVEAEATASGKTFDDVIDEHMQKLADESNVKVQDVGKYWDDTLRNTKGDFAQAYRNVKTELSRFYQKADLQGLKDGLGENAFTKAQREQQAAFNAGNVDAEDAAITRQRELFDKANGDGTYDEVKKQYPKLDAIEAINANFTARAVVKNTPSQFLKNLPAGQFDRGIIDGAALRTAVRELRADGTFAKAGVGDAQVLKLQRLGDLLERSKVRPDTIPAGFLGKIGAGVKTMTAGNQLAYLMTHADALDGVIKYLKGVGPASTAVGAAANLMTQPTHQYDESSGQVIPIQ